METSTYKTSTIFVSTGQRTRVFRSMEDLPVSLRKKLNENIAGPNSRTLIVADRRGREYLFRALKQATRQVAVKRGSDARTRARAMWSDWRAYSIEFGLIGLLGIAGWALLYWK